MSVKLENIEKNVVQLEIEVEASKFEEGMEKSFKKNAGKFNIPGFRKGKAPRKIIERNYGEGVFYEDAINFICPEAYSKAVEETKIDPVERPEIDVKQIGSGQDLIFTAKVTVKPEVEVSNYKGVEIEKVEVSVKEDDVEAEIKKVQEKNARIKTVEDRPVKEGDIAVIDFEGFIDDVAFEGGKGSDYSLGIGSGQFIPGFEEQLIGAELGSEVEVKVSFPTDYNAEDLAGKSAVFKVKINEIKEKELPDLDDEFAKDVSEFETLEEYKNDLKEKLLKDAEHKAKHETENKVIDKVVENTTVEIPKVMIDRQVDNLVKEFDYSLRYQGLSLSKYLEMMGVEIETFKKDFETRAEKEVKMQLALEKISTLEDVQVSSEELDEEMSTMAKNYKVEVEEFKKQLREEDIEYIKDTLKVRKTIKILVESAKIS